MTAYGELLLKLNCYNIFKLIMTMFRKDLIQKIVFWFAEIITVGLIFCPDSSLFAGQALRVSVGAKHTHSRLKETIVYHCLIPDGGYVSCIKIEDIREFDRYRQDIYHIAIDLEDTSTVPLIAGLHDLHDRIVYIIKVDGKLAGYTVSSVDLNGEALHIKALGIFYCY
jgi:hypothetical protein